MRTDEAKRAVPAKVAEAIAAGMKETGRSCGACSMCCKVLPIDDAELTKPADTWCRHCRPGNGGCSIYASRPATCAGFACQWLMDPGATDEWYPLRSKIVVHIVAPFDYLFIVDRTVPNRWREEPYFSTIKHFAFEGLNRRILPQMMRAFVIIGGRKLLILPDEEVDVTSHKHTLITGHGRTWTVVGFDTEAEAERFQAETGRDPQRVGELAALRARSPAWSDACPP